MSRGRLYKFIVYVQKLGLQEQDGRGIGRRGVHLSPWIYQEYTFRHRGACRTAASGQEDITSREEYIDPWKTQYEEGLGEKTGVLEGLDLPSVGGELKQGSDPHIGTIAWVRGETFKAESERADLWQPKWNENQTVLAPAIHTPDRDADPLEGAAAGNWSLGIVEQSQGEGCCGLWRDGSRGCEGGDCGGKCLWRKAGQPWKQGHRLSHT